MVEPQGSTPSRYHVASVEPDGSTSQSRLLRFVQAPSRVLDLGCSTGGLSEALALKGCEVIGVEASTPDLAVATSRLTRYIQADLDTDELNQLLPGESFDVIVAADILEHLQHPSRLLRMARELLAPEGFVAFSIPNVAHASVRLALWEGTFPYGEHGILDRTHLHMYTHEGMQELFTDAGFSITALERTQLDLREGVPHTKSGHTRRQIRAMLATPEALTLQFVGRASPVGERDPLPRRPVRQPMSKEQALLDEQARVIRVQAEQIRVLTTYWEVNERGRRFSHRWWLRAVKAVGRRSLNRITATRLR